MLEVADEAADEAAEEDEDEDEEAEEEAEAEAEAEAEVEAEGVVAGESPADFLSLMSPGFLNFLATVMRLDDTGRNRPYRLRQKK